MLAPTDRGQEGSRSISPRLDDIDPDFSPLEGNAKSAGAG